MIITKEMFDEFVESAENQNILWTDTLALIGVTVGDVPDVDVIEAQAAEIARLRDVPNHIWAEARDTEWDLGFNYAVKMVRAALAQETQP